MLFLELERLRDEVAERRFMRSCATITLRHDLPIQQVFHGPGSFEFDDAGKLKFKAIVTPRVEFPNNPERKAGDFIPRSELFKLVATDARGFTWHAESVWPGS